MAAYEILIADDHPLFRSALRQALTLSLGSTVRLVEAENIAELESCLQEKSDWDLVLLDLNMPGAHGFSGLVLLRGQYPQIPVVMISAQEESMVMARSREFGASGFIPKSSPLEDIQKAVQVVLDGDVWWPAQTAVVYRKGCPRRCTRTTRPGRGTPSRTRPLSCRPPSSSRRWAWGPRRGRKAGGTPWRRR